MSWQFVSRGRSTILLEIKNTSSRVGNSKTSPSRERKMFKNEYCLEYFLFRTLLWQKPAFEVIYFIVKRFACASIISVIAAILRQKPANLQGKLSFEMANKVSTPDQIVTPFCYSSFQHVAFSFTIYKGLFFHFGAFRFATN